ncbi:MAG: carboxypeptidase-like regulatory domain-containing protein [Dysgonamonadaceae bacterium]|jgi:hypothetical protein|nr:carboxypeptidase-like regulatory domain-containing protein [Dysgonamonadaceae bacterium]
MKKCYLFLLIALNLCMALPLKTYAAESTEIQQQRKKITGVITDRTGETVIGANVAIKGTSTGTITDVNGEFTLDVPEGAVLRISYIGFTTQEIVVGSNTTINITLDEDTQSLDEVIVVGYGTQKKSDITGSVTSVPKERLSNLPVANLAQSIQGVTAGVNVTQSSSIPGETASILTRGRSSVNLSTSPLVVVDGIAMSGDASLNDINPNDIASIEIL